MKRDADVLIAGGGIVGACAALGLRRAGYRVILIERAPPPVAWTPQQTDARVYALAPASRDLLSALGVWETLVAVRVSPYAAMQVWDDAPARGLRFEAAEVQAAQLGWIVEHGLLMQTLWAALSTAGVSVETGTQVQSFTDAEHAIQVELEDGRSRSAALLLAADGADSALRALANIETTGWDYAQQALVCHLRPQHSHAATAWQRFLPEGPLALLPLADGRVSVVWSSMQASTLAALDDAGFCQRLCEATQEVMGTFSAPTPRRVVPLRLLHARDYRHGRLLLLGDSAHVIHPLAGQGLNLGLGDVTELLQQLKDRPEDPGQPRRLDRVVRARKAAALDLLTLTDGLQRLFATASPVWTRLRRLGLEAVQRTQPLKRALLRRAMGY